MNHLDITRLRLDPHRTTLSVPGAAEVVLGVGIDHLASAVFRHAPPTPAELEQAIDIVEDALMATHLAHTERGELVSSRGLIRALPGLRGEGSRLTRDEVEALFQRMASVSLGNPGALGDLPTGRQACAALLVLRECMHHLGFEAVRIAAE
jgi:exopolyphosphatase/pppGpp-phosphohydrolase